MRDTANELKIMDCMPKFFAKIKWSQLFKRLLLLLLLLFLQLICACGHEICFFGAKKSSKVGIFRCIVCVKCEERECIRSRKGIFLIIDALVWCVDAVACISLQHHTVCVYQNILTRKNIKGQTHLDEWCTSLFCSSILSIANILSIL